MNVITEKKIKRLARGGGASKKVLWKVGRKPGQCDVLGAEIVLQGESDNSVKCS